MREARLARGVDLLAHGGGVREDARGAAVDDAREQVAVLRGEVARDHGAHGVAEHVVRQVGVLLDDAVVEELLVLHHGVRPGVAPVAPGVVGDGGGAMAHVVVGGHDVAGLHEGDDQVEVAARVLAEAVDELDDALGLGDGGDVDPAGHLVAAVGRCELDLVKHGLSSRWVRMGAGAFQVRLWGCAAACNSTLRRMRRALRGVDFLHWGILPSNATEGVPPFNATEGVPPFVAFSPHGGSIRRTRPYPTR